MIEIVRTPQGTFLCQNDVYDVLPDGRRFLVARAGQYISMAQATALGLANAPQAVLVGPSQVKSNATEINVTPDAKALAETSGIDLTTVTGSGKNGRILKSDIEALIG